MKSPLCLRALFLAAAAPVAAMLAAVPPAGASVSSTSALAELDARFAPTLSSMRAGLADSPAPLTLDERAALQSAQQGSTDLADLRAGLAPSDHEWKWLAIGAGIVLLVLVL